MWHYWRPSRSYAAKLRRLNRVLHKDYLGLSIAALAAILFSFKAIVAKWLYVHGVDATTVISLRLAFAGPVFFMVAIVQSHRANAVVMNRKDWGQIVLLGFLGYYLSSFLDFWGLEFIPAALERLILFLTPTIVALLSLIFLKKVITRRQWQALALSYAGVIFVLWDQLSFGALPLRAAAIGASLCFAACLSYSVYLILSGEMVNRLGSLRLAALALSISSVLTAIHYTLFAQQNILQLSAPVYALSAANAVFCTIAPVFLTMTAISQIGAARTSQLSMLGPVSLVFLGGWLLDEHISGAQVLGTAVVLIGVSWMIRPEA